MVTLGTDNSNILSNKQNEILQDYLIASHDNSMMTITQISFNGALLFIETIFTWEYGDRTQYKDVFNQEGMMDKDRSKSVSLTPVDIPPDILEQNRRLKEKLRLRLTNISRR